MESPTSSKIISWWDLAALLGFLALAAFYQQILPLLPDPVPTHFNALGHANGWTPKARLALVVFLPPLGLWGVLFLVGAVTALVPRSAGAVPIHALRGLAGLGMCGVMGGCLLVPRYGLTALFGGLLAFAFCLVVGIVFLVRDTWLALRRTANPEHYRCGVFYVNRQDPRLWVEKRVGIGWTLNFAHPAAGWMCLLMAAGAVALVVAVRTLVRL